MKITILSKVNADAVTTRSNLSAIVDNRHDELIISGVNLRTMLAVMGTTQPSNERRGESYTHDHEDSDRSTLSRGHFSSQTSEHDVYCVCPFVVEISQRPITLAPISYMYTPSLNAR